VNIKLGLPFFIEGKRRFRVPESEALKIIFGPMGKGMT
jgi:hypothetical protein